MVYPGKVYSINSLVDYEEKIEELQIQLKKLYPKIKTCFRGEKDRSYYCKPSIFRYPPLSENEDVLYKKVIGLPCFKHLQSLNEMDVLAYFQHYGIPTRLMDFTWCPYIALYFACKGEDPRVDNCPNCGTDGRVLVFRVEKKEANDTNVANITKACFTGHIRSKEEYIKLKHDVFVEYPVDDGEGMNIRCKAQKGLFLLVGSRNYSFELSPHYGRDEHVEGGKTHDGGCKEIIIEREAKLGIMKELCEKGICEETLFPKIKNNSCNIKNSPCDRNDKCDKCNECPISEAGCCDYASLQQLDDNKKSS